MPTKMWTVPKGWIGFSSWPNSVDWMCDPQRQPAILYMNNGSLGMTSMSGKELLLPPGLATGLQDIS